LFKGKDGLGGGDIKLFAMIGSFTGAHGVLFTIFLASLTGYLFGAARTFFQRISSDASIPFGPFISSAAIIYILWGKTVIDNYF
jgi:leader peptidase (prepilin peptidase)/N-methyltransferase